MRRRQILRNLVLYKAFFKEHTGASPESDQEFSPDGIHISRISCSWIAIAKRRKEWKEFIKGVGPYPASFNGKGIVTCAGGLSYFTCAWVNISLLRKKGCDLPVELWYQDGELNQETIQELAKLDVSCKNVHDYTDRKITHGYQLKPLAILYSSFKEVLYLDADNNCLANPAYLFEDPEYLDTGAVFWPDYWKTSKSNPIWKIVDNKDYEIPEQESGQLLINKAQCWRELNLCLYLNLHPFYYKILWGDKDTFRFAWLALKRPFIMIERGVGAVGFQDQEYGFRSIAMMQHDFKGKPLFIHSNLLKWDSRIDNQRFWTEIRRLKAAEKQRKIYLKYHLGFKKYFVSIEGETEKATKESDTGRLEQDSLHVLKELRNAPFYLNFLEEIKHS